MIVEVQEQRRVLERKTGELVCMAELYHDGVYLRVEVNYLGEFTTHPRSYSGGQKYLVTDMDFAALEYVEFVEFLLRFTGEAFERFSIVSVIAL